MNSATFLSAMRASGGGLISDSSSRSSLRRVLVRELRGAALRELAAPWNTAAATWPRAT